MIAAKRSQRSKDRNHDDENRQTGETVEAESSGV